MSGQQRPAASPPPPLSAPSGSRIEHVTQERPVNWLNPLQLLQSGLLAALAGVVGSFADSRALQAARGANGASAATDARETAARERLRNADSVWIDYIADTGDGWDATYTVAHTLARDAIEIDGRRLPRADLLLMGGDQVYPTPAGSAYRTRLVDPFGSALPGRPAGADPQLDPAAPLLLATPGNHDWYDGLRGFNNLFCSGQNLGGWQSFQRGSYFAVQLPHGWWLWGLDLQLESELDGPQRDYFTAQATKLDAGARVLLLVPEPSWIDEGSFRASTQNDSDKLRTIEVQRARTRGWKEIESMVATRGGRVAATLAGDLHHYARYAPAAGPTDAPAAAAPLAAPQRITCGGGGAFMLGTHHLPGELQMGRRGQPAVQRLAATYPAIGESRSLRNRAWQLPFTNPTFGLTLGFIYLLYAWLLQSASLQPGALAMGSSLFAQLAQTPWSFANGSGLTAIVGGLWLASPAALLWALLIVLGAAAFTGSSTGGKPALPGWIGGALHGLLHLKLAGCLIWALARLDLFGWAGASACSQGCGGAALPSLLLSLQVGLGGWLIGCLLFGLWLVACDAWAGWHEQEVFSAQSLGSHRCFLRMRVSRDGLEIHPIGIAAAARRWRPGRGVTVLQKIRDTLRLRVEAGAGSRFEPETPITPVAIEPCITVR